MMIDAPPPVFNQSIDSTDQFTDYIDIPLAYDIQIKDDEYKSIFN